MHTYVYIHTYIDDFLSGSLRSSQCSSRIQIATVGAEGVEITGDL